MSTSEDQTQKKTAAEGKKDGKGEQGKEDKKNFPWPSIIITAVVISVFPFGMTRAVFKESFLPTFWIFVVLTGVTPTIYKWLTKWITKKWGKPVSEICRSLIVLMFIAFAVSSFLGDEKLITEIRQLSSSHSKIWQTVPGSKKTLTGQGTEGDTAVRAAKFGAEIKFGDKIVITAKNGESFFVTDAGKWEKHIGVYEVVNQIRNGSGYLYISAEDRVELHFELQRFM